VWVRQLVEDETFWVTIAGACTALVIALVLEARTGRDELDQRVLQAGAERKKALEERDKAWERWQEQWDKYVKDEGERPKDTPSFMPLPEEDAAQVALAGRSSNRLVFLTWALWFFGAALVGSLVIASPAGYPGDFVAGLGAVITLVLFLVATAFLLFATSQRIFKG